MFETKFYRIQRTNCIENGWAFTNKQTGRFFMIAAPDKYIFDTYRGGMPI